MKGSTSLLINDGDIRSFPLNALDGKSGLKVFSLEDKQELIIIIHRALTGSYTRATRVYWEYDDGKKMVEFDYEEIDLE
jgi:hypothetical protein